MLFLLLSVASAWTAPLPSAPVATSPLVQYAPSARRPQPALDFASGYVTQAGARAAPFRAGSSAPENSARLAALSLALGALALAGASGVRRRQAACVVSGYRPRPYYDTYNDEYDRGRVVYDRYYDEYDRYGRSDRAYGRYDRYGPRYGAVNREGYGAIGAMPGSWARNAQERAVYRRHERYGHPAYEAGRVRRMGINAPAGYANTIRDAQYRRWSRDRDYDMYRSYDGFDDLDGPYDAFDEFDGPYDRVYGRYGGGEYDRELVD